jgi:PLD-like domain
MAEQSVHPNHASRPSWMRPALQEGRQQILDNLNEALIQNDYAGEDSIPLNEERKGKRSFAAVEAIFTNLEHRLCVEIWTADAVFGCMAWLTNKAILQALAQVEMVSLLVQKEDWLRPDSGRWTPDGLHDLYAALPEASRIAARAYYSSSSSPELPPVMCVGNCPDKKMGAVPRMHHKFMVFCNLRETPQGRVAVPYAVWTGSFNATHNGTRSLENAVLINSPEIASAYMGEWRALLGIAECLDWQHRWIAPEFRIGT